MQATTRQILAAADAAALDADRCQQPSAPADTRYCASLLRKLNRCRHVFGRFTLRCSRTAATACSTSLAQIHGDRCGAASMSTHTFERQSSTIHALLLHAAPHHAMHPGTLRFSFVNGQPRQIQSCPPDEVIHACLSQFRGQASRSSCSAAEKPRCGTAARAVPSRGRARSPACAARRDQSRQPPARTIAICVRKARHPMPRALAAVRFPLTECVFIDGCWCCCWDARTDRTHA